MIDKTTTIPAQATPETGLVFDLQLFADEVDGTDTSTDTNTDTNADGVDTTTDSTDTNTDTTDQTDEPAGAPESYTDFTMPEGFSFDKESAGDFLTVAKEMNLTQDQAQKLVDLYGSRMTSQQDEHKQQVEAWAVESKKQFKQAEIDLANKTLGQFADKEMIELLASTGFGNHPKMVGLFKTIGSKFSEGTFVDTTSSPAAGKPLYANSPGLYNK